MSVSAATPHARAPHHSSPWIPLLLVAYAVSALLGAVLHRMLLVAFALVLLVAALGLAAARRRSAIGIAAWLLFGLLVAAAILYGHVPLLLPLVPIAALLFVAWLFARTLRRKREPLVARCIRLIEDDARLDLPGVARYARGVTVYWTIVLAMQAALLALIWLLARPGGLLDAFGVAAPWSIPRATLAWYPEAGCWGVLVLAFAAEYLFRRWTMRGIPHPPLKRFVTRLVRHWPQVLREEASP